MSNSFTIPRTVALLARLPVGLPRQEYWSGLPFPSPGDLPNPGIENISCIVRWILYYWAMREALQLPCCCCWVARLCLSLLGLHGLKPTRLLCPWGSPGKNTGMGCHFLLQEIFLIQGSNPYLLCISCIAGGFFAAEPPGKLFLTKSLQLVCLH